MKRRPLTLIELLIGFTLASLVLGTLFTSLHEISHISSRLERAEKEVLGRAEFQQRVSAILGNLTDTKQKTPLYLSEDKDRGKVLSLNFHCGIDPNPSFSRQVKGLLFLDGKDFCLRVLGNNHLRKPLFGEQDNSRETILKRNVLRVEYEFLNAGKTSNTWQEEEEEPPDYLKITLLYGKDKKEEYAFWIKKKLKGVVFLR